jgi:uncharacterized membrane protein YeaQ/YmgE (transglycosylase-associated protein family)
MFSITLSQFIVYLFSAIICGYVVEAIFRSRMRFGFPGAVLAGLIGIFLVVNVLRLKLVAPIVVEGIPVVSLLAGAAAGAIVWGLAGTLWGFLRSRKPQPTAETEAQS